MEGEDLAPVEEKGNEEINNSEGKVAPVDNSVFPAVSPVISPAPANSEIPLAE